MQKQSNISGFALVTVLVFCLAATIIGAATLVVTSSAFTATQSQYYIKIAEEAAEAGVTYASSCLENNSRHQTWGPTNYQGVSKPTLKQNTNCDGSTNSTVTSVLVADDNRLATEFEVGNLDFISSTSNEVNGVQISAKGYARVKDSGGAYIKTYEATIKKTITWESNLEAQKSASGTLRTCGIMSGSAYCWGANDKGQLGNNSTTDTTTPVKVYKETGVLSGKKALDIAAGANHTCIIADDNQVYCWGANNNGQLGQGYTSAYSSVPVKVSGLSGKTIVKLGVTAANMCALTSTGELWCWGSNYDRTVGNNASTSGPVTSPVLIGGASGGYGGLNGKVVTGVTSSGAFNSHMCAIAQGKAYCWGSNDDGQLGIGSRSSTNYNIPTAVVTSGVLSGKTVTKISGDGNTGQDAHTCVVAYTSTPSDARAYCWGSNQMGQIGNNGSYTSYYTSPVAVDTGGVLAGKTITDIATGDDSSCTIANDRAYCWGENSTLGNSMTVKQASPVAVDEGTGIFLNNKVDAIVGGAGRMCARVLGKSYCWGANGVGQIGDGTTVSIKKLPTEALFLRPKNNQYIY